MLTPFECFGLGTLLPAPLHYLGTAEAVIASEVVKWDHAEIIRAADTHPEIRTNALRITLQFLGILSDRHSALFEGDASHRLAHVLIDLGRRGGGIHPEGIDVHITNEHLGALADVSRFTASRVLSDWSKKGVITKRREAVLIHSPEALLADSDSIHF